MSFRKTGRVAGPALPARAGSHCNFSKKSVAGFTDGYGARTIKTESMIALQFFQEACGRLYRRLRRPDNLSASRRQTGQRQPQFRHGREQRLRWVQCQFLEPISSAQRRTT